MIFEDFSSAHAFILWTVFGIAFVMGAVVNKTNFCTMGAVSDLVNMGDTGRIRAWVFAMAVAIIGVVIALSALLGGNAHEGGSLGALFDLPALRLRVTIDDQVGHAGPGQRMTVAEILVIVFPQAVQLVLDGTDTDLVCRV